MRKNKQSNNILFRYWLTACLIAITGLAACLYSAHSHYKNYTDPLYSSFCAISRAINCDTVAQSPWSIIFNIPVGWWGALFYLFFLLLLVTEKYRTMQAWRSFLFISLAASAGNLALAGIAVWKIKSLCIVCLTIYAITFTLTCICWIGKRRCKEAALTDDRVSRQPGSKDILLRNYGIAASIFIIGTLLLYFFLPRYWLLSSDETDISGLSHGLTDDGHPWIGAEEPQITVTQFSDYMCFQCGKMHFLLRQLLQEHPDTLRLVHRNYPMDHAVNPQAVPEPFHEGSGNLAKIAILAGIRDKFWQMNDLLYRLARNKIQEIPLQELADKTGLDKNEMAAALTHPGIAEMLRRDIWRGMKLGITGTPAFLIDGKVYQGNIPPDILKNIIELPAEK
ncbi:MAG: vitamin K epoxide reductase family protein [Candidatus Electrothrix sp. YB6]